MFGQDGAHVQRAPNRRELHWSSSASPPGNSSSRARSSAVASASRTMRSLTCFEADWGIFHGRWKNTGNRFRIRVTLSTFGLCQPGQRTFENNRRWVFRSIYDHQWMLYESAGTLGRDPVVTSRKPLTDNKFPPAAQSFKLKT